MRRHFLTIAVLSAAASLSAAAQEGSWGDGHAALFNAPMGYGSQSEINGQAKGRRPRDKAAIPTVLVGFTPDCINGIASNLQRPSAEETHGFLRYPCPDDDRTAKGGSRLSGTVLTVVTTGAWDTAITESKPDRKDRPAAALNGGLDLD